jgi:flagellar biosynthesis protein FlhF
MSTKKPREKAHALLSAAGFEGVLVRDLAAAPLAAQERDAVLAELRGRLRATLRVVGCRLQSSTPVIVTCVGPTGSGKTTTLAKLAAKAKFELGKSVHVVSLDTFRVGAIEQMKKFADLMEIPFSVAGDVASFEEALLEHDADVVLVDTPSRAPTDGTSLSRLRGCLEIARARAETEVLLVVPSYLRTSDVERLAAGYASCAPSAIVLTKIDEAERLGGAVGGAVRSGLPVAYLSAGPRVPEDLSTAEPDLADIALPGRA